jgi:hypothetical protein
MQRAFYAVAVQIPVGKQCELVRANITRRIDRAFNAIESDLDSFDLHAQNASVLKVA